MRLWTSNGVFSRVRWCFALFELRSWYFGHDISSSDRLEVNIIQPLGELVGIDEMGLQYANGGTRRMALIALCKMKINKGVTDGVCWEFANHDSHGSGKRGCTLAKIPQR